MKKVSVVVLDDSLFFREAAAQELEKDINIKVVGKAANPYDARDLIVELTPDVLVCDVNLGAMSGLEFVRKLLPQHYMHVIFISSDASNKVAAATLNVQGFIQKPSTGGRGEVDLFYGRLIATVKTVINGDQLMFPLENIRKTVIAIGASTGGADAIEALLKTFPSVMPPIVIAQHMPPQFTKSFAERVNQSCALSVKEAEDGDMLIAGQAYIAPGGYDMTVRSAGERSFVALNKPGIKRRPCPDIDEMFTSVAKTHGKDAFGILLTGMGKDGAYGLKAMHDAGAVTFAQDEKSSVVYGMPRMAQLLDAVDYQMSPVGIGMKCIELVGRSSSG